MSRTEAAGQVVFKDLCVDAVDAAGAAAFWGPALGLGVTAREGGVFLLRDDVDEHAVWVNPVPEPHTVKNRVHLDVHLAAVQDLVRRGATVLADDQPWTVLADPDGAELCAFVRPPMELPGYRLYELVVDAADPELLSRWWADRLAGIAGTEPGQPFWWVEGGAGVPWDLVFNRVPEPKTLKNRVHWDVWGRTEDLLAAGATLLRGVDDEIGWDVLADPEGNEFCAFRPGPQDPGGASG